MDGRAAKTCWHCLVGETLKVLLGPVGVEVRSEVQVVSLPPKADLILIQRQGGGWTEEQRLFLVDGLRDLDADHILIEIKVTESLHEGVLSQITVYDTLYLETACLERRQLRSVIISSTTPQPGFLERFAFEPVGPCGVYESKPRWGGSVRLILLNELTDEAQNAPLKCFSSRREERKKAFETIKHAGLLKLSIAFERIMVGLWRLLMKGALDIDIPEIEGITPEYVSGLGKEWLDWLVDATPDEDLAAMPKFGRLLVQSRQEDKASTLLRILRRRFSDLPVWVESRVHAANLDTLDAWIDRAIDARSLQDVFGDETTGRTM
ncbi:MAG: hypothetical protein HQL65_10415 [Magnetococcales bacterium]|nr:hypothetical protein [Magnetococcales bacterium]